MSTEVVGVEPRAIAGGSSPGRREALELSRGFADTGRMKRCFVVVAAALLLTACPKPAPPPATSIVGAIAALVDG